MRSISQALISKPSFEQPGGGPRIEFGQRKAALMLVLVMKHRIGI